MIQKQKYKKVAYRIFHKSIYCDNCFIRFDFFSKIFRSWLLHFGWWIFYYLVSTFNISNAWNKSFF